MRPSIGDFLRSLTGFITRHERLIFVTIARILAIGCLATAIHFAWKLSRQLTT